MDDLHAKIGMSRVVKKTDMDFTAADYCERYGVTISRSRDRLKKMIDAGHVEKVGMDATQSIVYRFTK